MQCSKYQTLQMHTIDACHKGLARLGGQMHWCHRMSEDGTLWQIPYCFILQLVVLAFQL